MTRKERFEKIVKLYNKWLKKYGEAASEGDWEKASYYAFLLNAVTAEILRAPPSLRKYFYKNSVAGNQSQDSAVGGEMTHKRTGSL